MLSPYRKPRSKTETTACPGGTISPFMLTMVVMGRRPRRSKRDVPGRPLGAAGNIRLRALHDRPHVVAERLERVLRPVEEALADGRGHARGRLPARFRLEGQ